MKRSIRLLLVVTLAFSFIFIGTNSVQAMPRSDGDNWNNPTVSPNSPVKRLKTEVVDPSQLPGTRLNKSGFYEPVGFGKNQAQFGGSGIVISWLPTGTTAKLCFSFPYSNYGWTGNVYKWTGASWVKFSTAIESAADGSETVACSNSIANGTYALIMGLTDTPKPPVE